MKIENNLLFPTRESQLGALRAIDIVLRALRDMPPTVLTAEVAAGVVDLRDSEFLAEARAEFEAKTRDET